MILQRKHITRVASTILFCYGIAYVYTRWTDAPVHHFAAFAFVATCLVAIILYGRAGRVAAIWLVPVGVLVIVSGLGVIVNDVPVTRIWPLWNYLAFFTCVLYWWSVTDVRTTHVATSVLAVLAYALVYVVTDDSFGLRANLSTDGSSRYLANLAGPAIILSIGAIFDTNIKKAKVVYLIGLVAAIGILIGTQSRGVLVAVSVALIVWIVAHLISTGIVQYRVVLGVILVIALLPCVLLWISMLGIDLERFVHRISDRDAVVRNPRISIWAAGLSQLHGVQWIVGAGLDSFTALYDIGNGELRSYYAHSIFVDAVASVGVSGVLALTWILASACVIGHSRKALCGLALVVFISVSYFTHGTLARPEFWAFLALGVCLAQRRPAAQDWTWRSGLRLG